MVLNIHSDASYMSEPRAHSYVSSNFFLSDTPIKVQLISLNGAIYVFTGTLKFVLASAAEAELAAFFLNCKEGELICLILGELGHK